MSKPRVLFYVQHLLGIGHLARASRVCMALAADGFDVTVMTGGMPVQGFPDPSLRHVALPPITSADGFAGLLDDAGNPITEDFKAARCQAISIMLELIWPDIVVIEAFPFGRRQMRFELLPMIDEITKMTPRPLLVTSVRDILQERVKPGRNEETAALVNAHFDLVMMHADPAFARLEDTFPQAALITKPVAYTGLVAPHAASPSPERFDIVVSAGGGAAGKALVAAAVEAAGLLEGNRSIALITGPNLPAGDYQAAVEGAPQGMQVYRFREDFAGLLANTELSVSQAGYNTVCDVLNAGCRALLVPFAAGGETEQTVRAERLTRLELATWIAEDGVTGPALAEAIEDALLRAKPAASALDLDGARGSARLLRETLDRHRADMG